MGDRDMSALRNSILDKITTSPWPVPTEQLRPQAGLRRYLSACLFHWHGLLSEKVTRVRCQTGELAQEAFDVDEVRQRPMPWSSKHVMWLRDTGTTLTTACGKIARIWQLAHHNDKTTLSAWAKHYRNHYCLDSEIDDLKDGTGLSRCDYLCQYVFPDDTAAPGPSIRAGDFAEILVADFLEFKEGYWVPRFKYDDKAVRNESTKGADILGFKIVSTDESPEDTLATFEAKAKLTGKPANRLQDAVEASAEDFHVRKAESLNALKRRLIRSGRRNEAMKVRRFQDKVDRPYHEVSGAAAVFSESAYDYGLLSKTDSSTHPNQGELRLVVIKGKDLMALVHDLYRRAGDEA